MKLILIFMSITENDQNTYYLELMFILLNRDLIFEEKRQKALEKKLVNLLELILVEKIMMQTIKLVEYKYLLVNLKKTK